jgi:penicillin-binding protein 2
LHSDDYRAIARENIVRKVTLATTRGIIRDRKGQVLAAARPAYNLYVVPTKVTVVDPVTKKPRMSPLWAKLCDFAAIDELESKRLEDRLLSLREAGGAREKQQILLKEDMSRDVVAVLATHTRELPGVEVVPVSVRYYPHKNIGAHVLGYMREVDADMLDKVRRSGYIEGDRIGASGVERAWESYLRGTRGWEKVLVDARGIRRQNRDDLIDEPRRIEPIPGRDLRLTLDADVQNAIDESFRGEVAGAVALIDIKTGGILGLVSKPAYDPNELSGGAGKAVVRESFRRLFNDPLKPAVDKTLAGAYPPGSTFKPFTALAALEKGLVDQREQTVCRGFLRFGRRIFRCTHSHGPTDLHKAIGQSCNVYFYHLVSERGVTMDMIAEMGMRYGFGQKTGIGINAESSGRMPTRAWMTLKNRGQFQQGFTVNAAIGQGATTVTVLQLALAYTALANGGTLYEPQIVRAVETADGAVVQEFAPRVHRRIKLDPAFRKLVHSALVAGVNEEGGTAYRARLEGVDMAGKTGSAQVSHRRFAEKDLEKVWYFNRDHAWFAGYSPTDKPEVAVVALVEHGGAGGKHAAPIAFAVVRAFQQLREKERAPGVGPTKGAP